MGMFDRVWFKCPGCSNRLELQSKASECQLNSFEEEEVPSEIAVDISGEQISCPSCDGVYQVTEVRPIPTVRMRLKSQEEDNT